MKNYLKNYNHFNNLNRNVVDVNMYYLSFIIIIFLLESILLFQLDQIFDQFHLLKFNVLSQKFHKIHHGKNHDYHFLMRKFTLIFFHMLSILNYYIISIHSLSYSILGSGNQHEFLFLNSSSFYLYLFISCYFIFYKLSIPLS